MYDEGRVYDESRAARGIKQGPSLRNAGSGLFATGRIGREHFWLYLMACLPIAFVPPIPLAILATIISPGVVAGIVGVIGLLFIPFGLLLLPMTLIIRRYHDIGKSGWWILVGFLPLVGIFWVFVECIFAEGQPRVNKWGPPP